MDFENEKDAFDWVKDNYSTLSEEEYKEFVDKWGKLKVYCPIISSNELLYELNELSFINNEWTFSAISTESDASKLNADYPILPRTETAQIDLDDDFLLIEPTVIDGSVKDDSVIEVLEEVVEENADAVTEEVTDENKENDFIN